MTDRLWFFNSSVVQSVMLSKDIEIACDHTPAVSKIKIKFTFSGRSLRVVVLVFFFIFLMGCINSKDFQTNLKQTQTVQNFAGRKKGKKLKAKARGVRKRFVYSFDFFNRFNAQAFLDTWTAELAKPNLIDRSFMRFTPYGGVLQYKKVLRPTLTHTTRLAYLDPGLEYFVQEAAQATLFIFVKGSRCVDVLGLGNNAVAASKNRFYLEALGV